MVDRSRDIPYAMKRTMAATLMAMVLCGCQTTPHHQHRVAAEENLNRLQGGVKFQLASQALENGLVEEAANALQEAIRLDPQNAEYHRTLAKCYLEQGQVAAAAAAADVAVGLEDQSADLFYVLGMIAQRRQRMDEALGYFAAARKREASNIDYLLAEAEALVTLERSKEALELIERRLVNFDRDPRLLILRAHVALLLGDVDQASADFAEAGAATRETPWHVEQYALALMRTGRYQAAIDALEPVVGVGQPLTGAAGVVDAPRPTAVRALASCYNRTGRPQSASGLLDKHLHAHPADAKGLWLRAEAALRMADWETARQCARAGRSLAPDQPQWRLIEAYLAWHQGDLDAAATILRKILSDHPEHVEALCLLGEVHSHRRDPVRAKLCYESALRVDPGCRWARTRLGGDSVTQ